MRAKNTRSGPGSSAERKGLRPGGFPRAAPQAGICRAVGPEWLKGGQWKWRIRVGDYRVVYAVDDVKLRVSVTQVRCWSEVYEG